MKKIILILSLLFTASLVLADDSFPSGRIVATGDEPNGDGQEIVEKIQAGVTFIGGGTQQVEVCRTCMTAGNILLSSKDPLAQPGVGQGAAIAPAGSTTQAPVKTDN